VFRPASKVSGPSPDGPRLHSTRRNGRLGLGRPKTFPSLQRKALAAHAVRDPRQSRAAVRFAGLSSAIDGEWLVQVLVDGAIP